MATKKTALRKVRKLGNAQPPAKPIQHSGVSPNDIPGLRQKHLELLQKLHPQRVSLAAAQAMAELDYVTSLLVELKALTKFGANKSIRAKLAEAESILAQRARNNRLQSERAKAPRNPIIHKHILNLATASRYQGRTPAELWNAFKHSLDHDFDVIDPKEGAEDGKLVIYYFIDDRPRKIKRDTFERYVRDYRNKVRM